MIGAGAFGVALGKVLGYNGHAVTYFDQKNPELTPETATEAAEVLILAIPSGAIPEFVANLPDRLKSLPVMLASKGLLSLEPFVGLDRFSVISGASFAEELMAGSPVTLTATDALANELFAGEQVTIELTDDILGVMLCGSLKNIYAIGAGALPEFQGTVAAYACRAFAELKQYLERHGANPATAERACGLADLMMTLTSTTSRNFRHGRALRMAGQANAQAAQAELGTVEGLATLMQVDREGYPEIEKVYRLASGL